MERKITKWEIDKNGVEFRMIKSTEYLMYRNNLFQMISSFEDEESIYYSKKCGTIIQYVEEGKFIFKPNSNFVDADLGTRTLMSRRRRLKKEEEAELENEEWCKLEALGFEITNRMLLKTKYGAFFVFSHKCRKKKIRTYRCKYQNACSCLVQEKIDTGMFRVFGEHTCRVKPLSIRFVNYNPCHFVLDRPFKLFFRYRDNDRRHSKIRRREDVRIIVNDEYSAKTTSLQYLMTWNCYHYYSLFFVLPYRRIRNIRHLKILVHRKHCDHWIWINDSQRSNHKNKLNEYLNSRITEGVSNNVNKNNKNDSNGSNNKGTSGSTTSELSNFCWELPTIKIFEIYPPEGSIRGGTTVEIYFSMTSPTGMNYTPYFPNKIEGFQVSHMDVRSVKPVVKEKRFSGLIWKQSRKNIPQYVLICHSLPSARNKIGFVDIEISTISRSSEREEELEEEEEGISSSTTTTPCRVLVKRSFEYCRESELRRRRRIRIIRKEDDDDVDNKLELDSNSKEKSSKGLVWKNCRERSITHCYPLVTPILENEELDDEEEHFLEEEEEEEINLKYNKFGMTKIHQWSCSSTSEEENKNLLKLEEFVRRTREYLYFLNQRDYFHNTPLHYAYAYKNYKIIKFLNHHLSESDEQQQQRRRRNEKNNYKGWKPEEYGSKESQVRNIYEMIRNGIMEDKIMKPFFLKSKDRRHKKEILNLSICSRYFYQNYHHRHQKSESISTTTTKGNNKNKIGGDDEPNHGDHIIIPSMTNISESYENIPCNISSSSSIHPYKFINILEEYVDFQKQQEQQRRTNTTTTSDELVLCKCIVGQVFHGSRRKFSQFSVQQRIREDYDYFISLYNRKKQQLISTPPTSNNDNNDKEEKYSFPINIFLVLGFKKGRFYFSFYPIFQQKQQKQKEEEEEEKLYVEAFLDRNSLFQFPTNGRVKKIKTLRILLNGGKWISEFYFPHFSDLKRFIYHLKLINHILRRKKIVIVERRRKGSIKTNDRRSKKKKEEYEEEEEEEIKRIVVMRPNDVVDVDEGEGERRKRKKSKSKKTKKVKNKIIEEIFDSVIIPMSKHRQQEDEGSKKKKKKKKKRKSIFQLFPTRTSDDDEKYEKNEEKSLMTLQDLLIEKNILKQVKDYVMEEQQKLKQPQEEDEGLNQLFWNLEQFDLFQSSSLPPPDWIKKNLSQNLAFLSESESSEPTRKIVLHALTELKENCWDGLGLPYKLIMKKFFNRIREIKQIQQKLRISDQNEDKNNSNNNNNNIENKIHDFFSIENRYFWDSEECFIELMFIILFGKSTEEYFEEDIFHKIQEKLQSTTSFQWSEIHDTQRNYSEFMKLVNGYFGSSHNNNIQLKHLCFEVYKQTKIRELQNTKNQIILRLEEILNVVSLGPFHHHEISKPQQKQKQHKKKKKKKKKNKHEPPPHIRRSSNELQIYIPGSEEDDDGDYFISSSSPTPTSSPSNNGEGEEGYAFSAEEEEGEGEEEEGEVLFGLDEVLKKFGICTETSSSSSTTTQTMEDRKRSSEVGRIYLHFLEDSIRKIQRSEYRDTLDLKMKFYQHPKRRKMLRLLIQKKFIQLFSREEEENDEDERKKKKKNFFKISCRSILSLYRKKERIIRRRRRRNKKKIGRSKLEEYFDVDFPPFLKIKRGFLGDLEDGENEEDGNFGKLLKSLINSVSPPDFFDDLQISQPQPQQPPPQQAIPMHEEEEEGEGEGQLFFKKKKKMFDGDDYYSSLSLTLFDNLWLSWGRDGLVDIKSLHNNTEDDDDDDNIINILCIDSDCPILLRDFHQFSSSIRSLAEKIIEYNTKYQFTSHRKKEEPQDPVEQQQQQQNRRLSFFRRRNNNNNSKEEEKGENMLKKKNSYECTVDLLKSLNFPGYHPLIDEHHIKPLFFTNTTTTNNSNNSRRRIMSSRISIVMRNQKKKKKKKEPESSYSFCFFYRPNFYEIFKDVFGEFEEEKHDGGVFDVLHTESESECDGDNFQKKKILRIVSNSSSSSSSSSLNNNIEKRRNEVDNDSIRYFTFDTHSELDRFVSRCLQIRPFFKYEFPGYYQLFKGFDRAFWTKNASVCYSSSSCDNNNNSSARFTRHEDGCPFNMEHLLSMKDVFE